MKCAALQLFFVAICICTLPLIQTPAHAQKEVTPDRLAFPQTDNRFDTIMRMHAGAVTAPQIDTDRLQREAKELLLLSQSLQPDIQQVKQGLLPKAALEKLKHIEKLSRQLRGELNQ